MIIHARVIPNSKEEVFEEISDNEFLIRVKEAPENGKANKRVVKIIAKEFGISVKDVKIKNPSFRKKIIEINKG